MTPEQKASQKAEGLQSPERRRFLKNSGIIAARLASLTFALGGAVDLARRPEAIVDITLNAKEKSPNATREEIKKEIHGELINQTERTLIDTGIITGGLLGVRYSGELELKDKTKNSPQHQTPTGIQPEPQK